MAVSQGLFYPLSQEPASRKKVLNTTEPELCVYEGKEKIICNSELLRDHVERESTYTAKIGIKRRENS